MKRTAILPQLDSFPEIFHPLLRNTPIFDSSCSKEAKVYYIDQDGGLFLKSAPKGTLQKEAALDAYFHSLRLGPEVLEYWSTDQDWLLTRVVPGEDCTHKDYLADPKRLAETMAHMLWELHQQDHAACPVPDHTARYIARARENYVAQRYDASLFPDNWGYTSAEEAWAVVEQNAKHLKTDTLLHGDYCLPNIMLDRWKPSGFIDLGGAGVGDKHIDLFWGAWTLNFNLKTDIWSPRFLDAYGREHFDPEMLRVVAAFEVFE